MPGTYGTQSNARFVKVPFEQMQGSPATKPPVSAVASTTQTGILRRQSTPEIVGAYAPRELMQWRARGAATTRDVRMSPPMREA